MSWKYRTNKLIDNKEFVTATLIMSANSDVSNNTGFSESIKFFKTPEKYMEWKNLFELTDKISFAKKPLAEKDVIKLIVKGRKNRGFYPKKGRS